MFGLSTRNIVVAGALAAVTLFATGCDKLKARDNLNKGVNAFRAGQYAGAADAFKEAISQDPGLPEARLYLATAYMSQYVPGSESAENRRNATAALDEFQKTLDASGASQANVLLATQSIASLYYNMKDFPKAEEWNKKVTQLDPNNKEAFYVLGVIAWTQFVPPDREARLSQNMKPEDPGPLKDAAKAKKGAAADDVKADLKAKYWQSLTDGVEDEKKALAIDPDYENAMAYMNLLIRYRADLDDTKDQYMADTKEADGWVQKNLETTKMKAAKKAAAADQGAPTQ